MDRNTEYRFRALCKTIIFIVFLSGFANAQPYDKPSPFSRHWYRLGWVQGDSGVIHSNRDTTHKPRFPGTETFWLNTTWLWDGDAWKQIGSGGGSGGNFAYNGQRPITRNVSGLFGVNPGTDSIVQFLNAIFYPSQAPNAGLTITYNSVAANSISFEMMTPGAALPATLNWSAGRASGTLDLSAVVVTGENISFVQPAAGSSVSGTKPISINRNASNTFTNTVTTTDGKSASSSASVNFYWRRYYGFVSSNSPSDASIIALTNEFATSRQVDRSNQSLSPSGSQYFVIAFPESFDPSGASKIWIGGLDQTATFNRVVRSFTNASGGTTSYIVYTSKNPTSGSIAYKIE